MKKKLKAVNSVKVVNTWEVSILRYTAVCINWRMCEFPPIDKKLVSCLHNIEDYSQSLMLAVYSNLEKMEGKDW